MEMNDGMQLESRWKSRLRQTIGVAVGFMLIYPPSICGCCFHALGAAINVLPVIWAAYMLTTYRDRPEQIVGWGAFAFAAFAIWMGYESNLIFAFR